MNEIEYPRVFLGRTVEGERIYLTPPSWDCGWYWGWGYIGNKDCHYHLSSLFKDKDMHTGIKEHFKTFVITNDKDLWTFCELVRTFYHLRETSDVLTRGGSHYTNNPCQELIKDAEYAKHINTVLIPAIFAETYNLFTKAVNPTGAKEVFHIQDLPN